MPQPHTDLATFACHLAHHLPGNWHYGYRRHAAYYEQFCHGQQVWGGGPALKAIHEFVLEHEVVMDGPGGQRLYIIDRPLRRDQFLVAPLAPAVGFDTDPFDEVDEPSGIAVPADGARAAAAVARRLLPHYRDALNVLRQRAGQPPDSRPAPAVESGAVALRLGGDGCWTTPDDALSPTARTVLYTQGFQHFPSTRLFMLPASYGVAEQTQRISNVARQLAPLGIEVKLHHTPRAATVPPPPRIAKPVSAPHR
ncbi:hypothetical protein [Streptomyces paromomycinus]|uniref:Uncharacterized protein n=1 Tax=Streptomyces paromomycinus TaxID=92743 RepID=A0A401VXT5_STREY|nr:hypothetical protein [Streptomyces paromomycinus]GCD41856.1 hypothetical protein GKJPGBOP_01513 [Streptomyces paromomycinus]